MAPPTPPSTGQPCLSGLASAISASEPTQPILDPLCPHNSLERPSRPGSTLESPRTGPPRPLGSRRSSLPGRVLGGGHVELGKRKLRSCERRSRTKRAGPGCRGPRCTHAGRKTSDAPAEQGCTSEPCAALGGLQPLLGLAIQRPRTSHVGRGDKTAEKEQPTRDSLARRAHPADVRALIPGLSV